MNFLHRIWGLITTIPGRLKAQWGLVLAAILGLVSSISLILSIPLYADSIYYQILQTNLDTSQMEGTLPRPPFAFLFNYYGGWTGPLQWEDIQDVDAYFAEGAVDELGLPLEVSVRYISTDNFSLFPRGTSAYDEDHRLTYAALGFMDDLEDHTEIVEGRFPAPAPTNPDDPIEVLVHERLATDLGLQVGETYTARRVSETPSGKRVTVQYPVQIAGIWRPLDPSDSYWISNPAFYEQVLFVPEESFSGRISTYLPDEVFSAYWYLVMGGDDVHAEDVPALLAHINTVEKHANYLLPDIRLSVAPTDALWEYRQSSQRLTILLYAFSVPILGLILAFIGLVSRLSVERQRNEIAILRSRGAAPFQIIGLIGLEGLLLGLVALLIGLPVAVWLTRVIASTRSFLDLGSDADGLRVAISSGSLKIGFAAVALVLLAMILPAMNAARHTIISYKQETGRVAKPPFWQRSWLDLLLFIPAAYGTYLLQQQGSIALVDVETVSGLNDPFQNPLLFLVPALAIFALTLFSLRLIHPLMAAVAWLAGRTRNASLTLAARQLSRAPGSYHAPLIILILTVSLSSYTASLAATLDNHLYDQSYYRVGADIQFLDAGSSSSSGGTYGRGEDSGNGDEGPTWVFLPVDEYRNLDGVENVARLGRYTAKGVSKAGDLSDGVFIGIDRIDFPLTAFWRDDFAPQSLGAMMNALAVVPNGVLVDRRVLDLGGYKIGDTLPAVVTMYGSSYELDFQIVGAFDLFPTWYPDQGPLLVGNLDYLFQQMGGEFPYRVLLDVRDGVDPRAVATNESGISRLMSWSTPVEEIESAQVRPERQGLLGFLFIGFVTAALLTVLAFLLYMIFSFQRRFIELGVLRAAGLSLWQMSGYLVWELFFLIAFGGAVGTALGYLASVVYIPFMQVGTQPEDLIPPFDVLIAWGAVFKIYWMFGILFALTLAVSVALLRRMRVFQAVKLGETV